MKTSNFGIFCTGPDLLLILLNKLTPHFISMKHSLNSFLLHSEKIHYYLLSLKMSSIDEENSRDSVNNDNEQSDDHKTVISENQTPPDTEEVEIDAENMEEINQKFVLAAKEGRTSDVIRLWTDNNAFNIDYTSGRDEWSAIHFAASDGNLELPPFKDNQCTSKDQIWLDSYLSCICVWSS